MSSRRKILHVAKEIAVWALTLFLVMILFKAGTDKMSDDGGWARAFRHWGYPVWFRVAVGLVELAAAFLLLVPRTARYGCLLIMATMLGGMGTHIVYDNGRHLTSELGPLIFSTIVFLARRRDGRLHPFQRRLAAT
jgi:uncharacterized membrane protein YphA (DoxX/SURF4 family)